MLTWLRTHTHTYTHIHMYIYMPMCVYIKHQEFNILKLYTSLANLCVHQEMLKGSHQGPGQLRGSDISSGPLGSDSAVFIGLPSIHKCLQTATNVLNCHAGPTLLPQATFSNSLILSPISYLTFAILHYFSFHPGCPTLP